MFARKLIEVMPIDCILVDNIASIAFIFKSLRIFFPKEKIETASFISKANQHK